MVLGGSGEKFVCNKARVRRKAREGVRRRGGGGGGRSAETLSWAEEEGIERGGGMNWAPSAQLSVLPLQVGLKQCQVALSHSHRHPCMAL